METIYFYVSTGAVQFSTACPPACYITSDPADILRDIIGVSSRAALSVPAHDIASVVDYLSGGDVFRDFSDVEENDLQSAINLFRIACEYAILAEYVAAGDSDEDQDDGQEWEV